MRPSPATLLTVVALTAMAPAARADTFVDTTPGLSAFAVPVGVSSLSVSLTGGAGGDQTLNGATVVAGGRGALATGTVAVSAGQQLQLTVGTNGGNGNSNTGATGAAGAPDGGAGGWSAGGGGGATRVLSCQGITCSVAVIAAGGGGAGSTGAFQSPPVTLAGGPGGAAGARGTDGASSVTVSGGSGGTPGTPSGAGTGGTGGTYAGGNGTSPAGGAGGNQVTGTLPEGGGGGGGGVFGGGGGGSGAVGMEMGADLMLHSVYSAGGGGGGGSSLAPTGGTLTTAAPGAVPRIVLTWTVPAGPGPAPLPSPTPTPGPGSDPGALAVASGETLSPKAFPAAPSGPSALGAKRRYGTKVGFTLNVDAGVSFTVTRSQPGRTAKSGSCAKPTKANRKAHRCTRLVTLGGFTRAGTAGANSLRFTGRIAGRKLAPGAYRLVATPSVGTKTGRAASASFQIIK